jgi:hypothetical protein
VQEEISLHICEGLSSLQVFLSEDTFITATDYHMLSYFKP